MKSEVAYFRFNVATELSAEAFETAMSEADYELQHELVEHTELVAADMPFVVIRAQLAHGIDEDELLELADDVNHSFSLDGEALTAELEDQSLNYLEA